MLGGCVLGSRTSELPSVSPGKLYSATIQDDPGDAGHQHHSLIVESSSNHAPIFSLPLERGAEVIWSPDGKAVAVIDKFASNENRVEIFGLPPGQRLLTISRDSAFAVESNVPSPTSYSHVYFSDVVWAGSQKVKLKLEMYDRLNSTVPKDYEGSVEFAVMDNP